MVLEKINQVGDIKQIPPEEYDTLAEEIPAFSCREDQPGAEDIWLPIWVW